MDQAGFYNAEAMSMTALLGAGKKVAQQRESIYKTYQAMQFDPIISGALRINVTSALGADQETGRMVHIEANAKMSGNKKMTGYAQEVADDLSDLLNKHIVNGALLVAQLLSQLKDTGLDAKATSTLLERVAKMDTDDAKLYAEALESARAASKEEDAKAGGFGGGFGGQ